jgi:hypothetical protein
VFEEEIVVAVAGTGTIAIIASSILLFLLAWGLVTVSSTSSTTVSNR